MNKKSLTVIALILTTTLIASSLFAERYDDHNDSRNHDRDRDYQDHRNEHDHHDGQQWDHQPRYMQNHQAYRHDLPRPHHEWRRGQTIPSQYRRSDYYIDDWQRYDLPAPPHGHRWLNVNGDYVLVAVATGVIASILLGGH
ncbi:RcnB family protein [Acinetobacter silvestris]|uniref:RcnB family protein n=1 Tax=Acinetobacter silvestris TaxID=1977882 RepID=A0A1Y3CDQ8_9GAMM|nr:RcnB family protein [Acinetobacter silvestris]OTG65197.1 hypothetical protein B9T28_10460 [Acinetobacter silvestris]